MTTEPRRPGERRCSKCKKPFPKHLTQKYKGGVMCNACISKSQFGGDRRGPPSFAAVLGLTASILALSALRRRGQ